MIYFYAISKEIDNTQIENVSKQPFWSFLWKEYKISDSIVFQFKWSALILICFGISYTDKFFIDMTRNDMFVLCYFYIPDKIRIALNILLLPCIAFYLIQIPFKLKRFWLYLFLVFFVFFLAHYFIPRIAGGLYPSKNSLLIHEYNFSCFQYTKDNDEDNDEDDNHIQQQYIVCIFLILSGMLLFFKFPYNHWVSFAFGILIFCIIIFLIMNFYIQYIMPYTSMYNFGTQDFYKFSFKINDHPEWIQKRL